MLALIPDWAQCTAEICSDKKTYCFLTMRSSVITYSKNQHPAEQRRGSCIHEQRIFSYLFCTDIYENNGMDLLASVDEEYEWARR